MHLLSPEPSTAVDLDALYEHPAGVVRANMVSSLDGAVRDDGGVSGGLSSPADKKVFGALRGQCDVVLVGAGTVRKEGYGPARPSAERRQARRDRGQSRVPPIAVVSRSLDLDLGSPFFTEAKARPIVVTVEAAPVADRIRVGDIADVVVAGEDDVDISAAIAELGRRGLTRVLCEGGPHLLTDLAASGSLDELCLTMKLSVVGGDSGRLVSGPAIHGWDGEVRHVMTDGTHLFLRVARR
jgi:riboflavin biosynthesis pyrimidine reductase